MELQTLEGQRAHYAGVRRRLEEAARRHEAAKRVKAAPPPTPEPAKPQPRDWMHVASDEIEEAIRKSSPAYVKNLIAETAVKYGISVAELISESRSKHLILARHEVCWRIRKETTWSYPRIGRILGNRDHTSILNGVIKHEKRLREAANAQG